MSRVALASVALAALLSGERIRAKAPGPEAVRPQIVPTVSWAPLPLQAGSPLGAAQLDASANVAGTFLYSPSPGTVFDLGIYTLNATFTPDDQVTYEALSTTATLVVYSGSVTSTIGFDRSSDDIVSGTRPLLDPATNRLFVEESASTLRVVNLSTGSVVRDIDMGVDIYLHMAADFGRRWLYVPAETDSIPSEPRLQIVDLDSGELVHSISLPAFPSSVAVDPNTGWLFMTTFRPDHNFFGPEALYVVDPTAPGGPQVTLVQSNLGIAPVWDCYPPAIDPASKLLYLTAHDNTTGTLTGWYNSLSTHVVDIDGTHASYGTVVATIPYATAPYVIDRQHHTIYAATSLIRSLPDLIENSPNEPASVSVIDADPASPQVNTVIQKIPVAPLGSFVINLALNPARGLLYAVVGSCNQFLSYDDDCRVAQPYPGAFGALLSVDLASRALASTRPLDLSFLPYINADNDQGMVALPALDRVVTIPGFNHPLKFFSDPQPSTAPVPASTSAPPVTVGITSVDFDAVTQGGTVQVQAIDPASLDLTLPGQFAINGGAGFEVSTTATFTGSVGICFNMASVTDPDQFAALTILHGEGGAWVPYATTRNFDTGMICATVPSLSPFAVGRLNTTYQVQIQYDATKAFKGGSTAPVKLQVLSGGVNVSSPAMTVNAKGLRQVSSSANFFLQDAGNANPDNNFRYDANLHGYIFNLTTKGLAAGTYEMVFTIGGDRSYHTLQLQVR